jgi:hypothetical protein
VTARPRPPRNKIAFRHAAIGKRKNRVQTRGIIGDQVIAVLAGGWSPNFVRQSLKLRPRRMCQAAATGPCLEKTVLLKRDLTLPLPGTGGPRFKGP